VAVEAVGFKLPCCPLLHRPVASVVHVAAGLPSRLPQYPWWWLGEWDLEACGSGFTRGASLQRLLAALSCHHAGP
jgi:hypothetical protein